MTVERESTERWLRQSRMSDPARHQALVAALPADPRALTGVVQGVLVHSDWLAAYGLDPADYKTASRDTLPVADRLDGVLALDPGDLRTARPPGRRSVGTCRDYALMLCAFLRGKGIPARVRCGFASYFNDHWEDHWVCEYWDAQARIWRLSDAQLDGVLRQQCRVGFDTTDVPRQSFVTAGQAWLDYRRGQADPGRYGHGDVAGAWFIKVNVLRDHHVLNDKEMSAWDGWRLAAPSNRVVEERELAVLDDLAAHPEQKLVDVAPDWQD